VATLLARLGFPVFDRLLAGRISGSALRGAEIAFQRGDRTGAGHLLDVVVSSKPRDFLHLVRAAELSNALGDAATANRLCGQVLRREPRQHEALSLQAKLDLPGPEYLEVLRHIHATLRPRTYVEIGVEAGESLRLAGSATRAIGVDPEPVLARPPPANASVFAMTSDEFFNGGFAAEALAGTPIDLAFIDGMHQSEFTLRDFVHVERWCTPASTVLIHDCYPLNRMTAERERSTAFWSGDVWRAIVVLRRHRPDLKIQVIAAPPTGLAVVRGLDPTSKVLADNFDAIAAEMLAIDYGILEKDKAGVLNRFPNERARITEMLAA